MTTKNMTVKNPPPQSLVCQGKKSVLLRAFVIPMSE